MLYGSSTFLRNYHFPLVKTTIWRPKNNKLKRHWWYPTSVFDIWSVISDIGAFLATCAPKVLASVLMLFWRMLQEMAPLCPDDVKKWGKVCNNFVNMPQTPSNITKMSHKTPNGQGPVFFTSKTHEMPGNFTDRVLCFFYIINIRNAREFHGQGPVLFLHHSHEHV